jgi:hypothetical protein
MQAIEHDFEEAAKERLLPAVLLAASNRDGIRINYVSSHFFYDLLHRLKLICMNKAH